MCVPATQATGAHFITSPLRAENNHVVDECFSSRRWRTSPRRSEVSGVVNVVSLRIQARARTPVTTEGRFTIHLDTARLNVGMPENLLTPPKLRTVANRNSRLLLSIKLTSTATAPVSVPEEQSMKSLPRALVMIALALSFIGVVAFARELGAREAREKIAQALGFDKPDNVHIKNISRGLGSEAIVEAQFDAAFRFTTDKDGKWQAVELRAGDRKWESIELIQTALRKEKALRTGAELRTIATALEAYHRDSGSYVQADSGSKLLDHLAPRYLSSIIRLDAWSQELNYKGSAAGYRLSSLGADGKPGTDDDIVFENGRLVKGAIE